MNHQKGIIGIRIVCFVCWESYNHHSHKRHPFTMTRYNVLLVLLVLDIFQGPTTCHGGSNVAAFSTTQWTKRSECLSSPETATTRFASFQIRHTSVQTSYITRHQTTQLEAKHRAKKRFSFLNSSQDENGSTEKRKIRRKVKDLAKGLVSKPFSYASNVVPMPAAIASVLKEASLAAVDQVEDLIEKQQHQNGELKHDLDDEDTITKLIDEAFAPMEASLDEMEENLTNARKALKKAKSQSLEAVEAIQLAAIAQAEGAATAVAQAGKVAERKVIADIYSSAQDADVSNLSFEDIDFDSSEMAPPFLNPDSCLVPGEPVVRVEKAPENSRRIFAGVDIMASVDDVWNILTNYERLQDVVPNLSVNEVLELYEGTSAELATYEADAPEEVQCKQIAEKMKGALLKQVGGAKVAGINFSAKTTLEVREWPQGMPDFAHFNDEMWMGKSREDRAKEYPKVKLQRYRFPRPFAVSSLPTRDISMQSIENDDGEFRMYQGVWRMQPLPGCAPPGSQAMRLTYAVEISPRAYLPVQLVENRIAKDLCTNLEAIRNAVTKS